MLRVAEFRRSENANDGEIARGDRPEARGHASRVPGGGGCDGGGGSGDGQGPRGAGRDPLDEGEDRDAGRPAGLTKLTKLAILGLLLFIALPVLFILGLSLTREVLLNWLLPSALVLSALAALRWPSSRRPCPAAVASLGLSLTASVVLCLVILIPLMLREPRWMLSNARDIYGWEAALGDLVAYRDAEFPDHSIAGNYYLLASQLAFHQNEVRASVGDDPRPHQFQLFAETPAGGNSRAQGPLLVLTTDQASGQAALEGWYCELQPLRPWPIVHRGLVIDTPFLFRVDQRRSDADPGCAPAADAPETDPTGSD